MSPKVKTMEGEGIEAHSLARNISRVKGRAGTLGWDKEGTRKIDKQFTYSHGPTQTKQQVG